jgi:hypothetical protein
MESGKFAITIKAGSSAALRAAGHDGGVETLAEAGGEVVNLMGAVDFDGLPRGVENDLAVPAAAQVGLQFGTRLGSNRVIDQVVEKGEKLFAGHFILPVSMSPFFL